MVVIRTYFAMPILLLAASMAGAQQNTWMATWASSPQSAQPDPREPLLSINNQTVRERLRTSVGGRRLCIRLSNEFGSTPLLVGAVTVAESIDTRRVNAPSLHGVTFGGRSSVTIPPGAPMLSDPIEFPLGAGEEISISLYFPKKVATPTLHALALKRAVVSSTGDFTGAQTIEGGTESESSILLSAILVSSSPGTQLLVAFGDSITDGDESTLDADRNWPSDFAHRLSATAKGDRIAVVNEGIAGNRLLSDGMGVSALARFDRDALAVPSVTHVVVLEGINDIGWPGAMIGGHYLADPEDAPAPEDLICAYRQLVARAHARGIKIIGATLTPFEGARIPGYYSDSKEAVRQAVNQWIRTSGAFDAIIDFDAVLRDPERPTRLLPEFSSKDHIHPNDAGYKTMADAVDPALFK